MKDVHLGKIRRSGLLQKLDKYVIEPGIADTDLLGYCDSFFGGSRVKIQQGFDESGRQGELHDELEGARYGPFQKRCLGIIQERLGMGYGMFPQEFAADAWIV